MIQQEKEKLQNQIDQNQESELQKYLLDDQLQQLLKIQANKEEQLKQFQTLLFMKELNKQQITDIILQIDEKNQNAVQEILDMILQQNAKKNYFVEQLELYNQQYKSVLIEITTFLECSKCCESFDPKDNAEPNCNYHTGSLRFFSCKACGADQYYDCCNKCKKCSKGCKQNFHIAVA